MIRILPLLSCVIGCAGDDPKADTGTDTDTDTGGETATDDGTLPVYPATWEGVKQLFAAHCDSCHPSRNGFDLDVRIEQDIEGALGEYVVPGSAQGSFLWQVVSGASLLYMPPEPAGLLDPAVVEPVRAWIDAGAPLE